MASTSKPATRARPKMAKSINKMYTNRKPRLSSIFETSYNTAYSLAVNTTFLIGAALTLYYHSNTKQLQEVLAKISQIKAFEALTVYLGKHLHQTAGYFVVVGAAFCNKNTIMALVIGAFFCFELMDDKSTPYEYIAIVLLATAASRTTNKKVRLVLVTTLVSLVLYESIHIPKLKDRPAAVEVKKEG